MFPVRRDLPGKWKSVGLTAGMRLAGCRVKLQEWADELLAPSHDRRDDRPARKPEDFARLAEGQTPMVVIVGAADSRVPPEVLFDQGVGDLFVVRVAGNVVGGSAILKGSTRDANDL